MPSDSAAVQGESPYAALIRLATAYQASEALLVAARLGLADRLVTGMRRAEDLAAATGTHAPSLRRLLRALAAFGLVREEADGGFAPTPLAEGLTAVSGSARDAVLMFGHAEFRRSWAGLEHSIRTGTTVPPDGAPNAEARAAFDAGMRAGAATIAAALLAAFEFGGVRHVVDVGGGQGALLGAILRARPALRGTLLDCTAVVAGAGATLRAMGVAERCEAMAGDMFEGVPEGGDLYLLARVIHDWDDARAAAILARCRAAMAPEARLLLVERLLPERVAPSVAAQGHLLSDLNMLVRTGGRERTRAEHERLLAASALRLARVTPTATPWSVLEAVPD